MDAEKIRNCVLHANGRISLLKDNKRIEVENIIDKKYTKLTKDRDRVVISEEYLQMLNENITRLMDIINNSPFQSPKETD